MWDYKFSIIDFSQAFLLPSLHPFSILNPERQQRKLKFLQRLNVKGREAGRKRFLPHLLILSCAQEEMKSLSVSGKIWKSEEKTLLIFLNIIKIKLMEEVKTKIEKACRTMMSISDDFFPFLRRRLFRQNRMLRWRRRKIHVTRENAFSRFTFVLIASHLHPPPHINRVFEWLFKFVHKRKEFI